jgi:signal peptidase I
MIEQNVEQQVVAPAVKPRNGFIAFVLSLLLPGLGQIYNGQFKKGIFIFVSILLVPFLFGITRGTTYFYGLLGFVVIAIAWRIYALVDAVRHARKQKGYVPKPYNTWYYHLLIAAGMFAVLMLYDQRAILGTQTFRIPTTSNNPTFQVGDCVVADLRTYDNSDPDYGHFVIFLRSDGQMYMFRVVGLPGDVLELNGNIVTVIGKTGGAKFIQEAMDDQFPAEELEEVLPNGHKHHLYRRKHPFDGTMANIENITVPPNSYFVLGDNRDNALDSRYEGFVSRERIKGRVIYSYWGSDGFTRMNINFKDK